MANEFVRLTTGSFLITDPDDAIFAWAASLPRSRFYGLVASDGKIYYPATQATDIKRWGAEDEMEDPKLFRSLKTCRRRCAIMQEDYFSNTDWRPMIWFSGDIDMNPLERYMQMTGRFFPTCPRQ